jgi:SdrD B-like domain/G8 domain
MTVSHLLKCLSKRLRRASRKAEPIFRPNLLALEDRVVLDTLTWIGPDNGLWSVAANWSGNKVPGANDTVVFDNTAGVGANTASTMDLGAATRGFHIAGLQTKNGYIRTLYLNNPLFVDVVTIRTPIAVRGSATADPPLIITQRSTANPDVPTASLFGTSIISQGSVYVPLRIYGENDHQAILQLGDTNDTDILIHLENLTVADQYSSLQWVSASVFFTGTFVNKGTFLSDAAGQTWTSDDPRGNKWILKNYGTLTLGKGKFNKEDIQRQPGSRIFKVATLSPGPDVFELSGAVALNNPTETLEVDSGTLQIDGNLTLSAGVVDVEGGAIDVSGSVAVSGGAIDLNGTTLTVGGDFTQTGGSLEVNGDLDMVSSSLTVGGHVTLSGASLAFDPTDSPLATSYTVIKNTGASSVSGIFANLPEGTVVPVNGVPFVITYQGGDGNDVVLTQPTISGRVWNDTNGNGNQDPSETGLLGVMVKLLDTGNNVIATATTNSSGDYGFINLSPGDYSVLVISPSGYVFSPEDQGSDSTLNSDVNSSGQTASVTVSTGGEVDNLDAGLVQAAQITGRVWNDANGNGIQETGEAGYSGVTVQLLGPTNTVVTTTTADPAGFYSFNGVALGTYSVRFVAPSGYAFTLQNQGSDPTLNSAANSSGQTATFSLTAGSQVSNLDAGLTQVGVVSGRVWLDTNINGIQNTGEAGYAGVTVELLNASNLIVATTTTDSSGDYEFDGVAPGTYSVLFIAPSNYAFTLGNRGSDPTVDSDAAPFGGTPTFTVSAGVLTSHLDAGLAVPVTVTWTGAAGDGDWNDPANWNSGTVPNWLDDVVIPTGDTATISNVTTATIHALTVTGELDVLDESELIVDGSVLVSGGTISVNHSGLGVGGDVTLNGGSLQVDSTNGDPSFLGVSGDFTLTGGSLETTEGSISIGGSFSQTLGVVTLTDGTFEVGEDYNQNGGILSQTESSAAIGGVYTASDGAILNVLNVDSNLEGFFTAGDITIGSGCQLNLAAGWLETLGNISITSGATLAGNGVVQLDTSGTALYNDGTITLDNSGVPGSLTVNGDYVQTGTLNAELSYAHPSSLLTVTGSATLGGTLNVTLLDGTPSVGDNFDLVHYGSRSGTFDTIHPPSLSTVNWDFRYDDPNYPTDLSLWVVS